MIKIAVLLFVSGLAFAEEKSCNQDPDQLCANIKEALSAINKGAQEVGSGIHVEEVKKRVDGHQESSNINSNFTLLLMALDKSALGPSPRICLKETAEQSAALANYIDTLAPKLENDQDIVLNVQRNLRSVSKLYKELETFRIIRTSQIVLERDQICKNINANFDKIDSGTTRIANGEDVKTVKAEVDDPQLASDIKNDYIRLAVVSRRVYNKDINECLAKTKVRADQQRERIEGILDKLTDDKEKVNAVFKDFREINQLQEQLIRCPTKAQELANKVKTTPH